MYTLTRAIVLLLFTMVVNAQDNGATLIVNIQNISSEEGRMYIGLYAEETTWLQKPMKGTIGTIENGASTVSFQNVPNGTYAISVFHDADDDGELDSFLGIPTEPTGSSNDAPARFGPPRWKEASFEVSGSTVTQTINL